MKLIDKFLPYCDHDNAENCVDVAKDFAIGFAEWLSDNNIHEGSIKQLLEIYKKENC